MLQKKPISQLSNEEILRQQLELLAERSKDSDAETLTMLTDAMIKAYDRLNKKSMTDTNDTAELVFSVNKESDSYQGGGLIGTSNHEHA